MSRKGRLLAGETDGQDARLLACDGDSDKVLCQRPMQCVVFGGWDVVRVLVSDDGGCKRDERDERRHENEDGPVVGTHHRFHGLRASVRQRGVCSDAQKVGGEVTRSTPDTQMALLGVKAKADETTARRPSRRNRSAMGTHERTQYQSRGWHLAAQERERERERFGERERERETAVKPRTTR